LHVTVGVVISIAEESPKDGNTAVFDKWKRKNGKKKRGKTSGNSSGDFWLIVLLEGISEFLDWS
jgi:hypothetical protein